MSRLSHGLAGTLSLATLFMSLASIPVSASGGETPQPSATPQGAPAASEGMIRLRREAPTINLESILDSNQPDFFLDVTIGTQSIFAPLPSATPQPEPSPSPSPTPTPEPTPSPTPSPATASVSPEPATASLVATPSPTPEPVATPAIPQPEATPQNKPAKSAVQLMYQAQRLAQLGQYRKALTTVEEAIVQEPESASLYALKGSLCVKLRDYAEAEAAWTHALDLDPMAYDVKASLNWLRRRAADNQP